MWLFMYSTGSRMFARRGNDQFPGQLETNAKCVKVLVSFPYVYSNKDILITRATIVRVCFFQTFICIYMNNQIIMTSSWRVFKKNQIYRLSKPPFDFIFCEKLTPPFNQNGFVIRDNNSFLTLILPEYEF